MRVITIANPKILDTPYTVLSQDHSSGSTMYVEDSNGFSDNDLILIGGRGNEKAEVVDLTSAPPTAGTLAVSTTDFAHDSDESVQRVLYDKYDIQYKTTEGGSWTALVTSGSFDWGNDVTEYVHSDGQASYYYRSRYYNSATATYSGWSDTVIGSGLSRLQVGWIIQRARKKGRDENSTSVEDADIIESINTVNDIVRGLNRRWWFLKTEYEFDTVADTKEYDLPSDYERAHRLKYNFNDGTANVEYYLRYLSLTQFEYEYRNLNMDSSDDLVHYTIDDINDKIIVGPPPATAGYNMTLVYYKSLTDVDSYGDTVPIPIADLYVHFAAAEIWELKDNEEKASYYKREFTNLLEVLEQMRATTPTPRNMKTWRGRKAMKRLFGSRRTYSDEERENNW